MRTKILITGLACLFLISLNWTQEAKSKTHFRDATWGMSPEQVGKIEKSKSFQKLHSKSTGLDIVGYKGQAGAFKCFIAYYFAENQLVEGRYSFIEKHTNRNLYISDFKNIKDSLIEKYGKATKDNVVWRNDLYKDDPSDWGMAVSVGHLNFEATWKLPETKIHLLLKGDNYKITHILDYMSEIPKYKELMKKAIEKAKKGIW